MAIPADSDDNLTLEIRRLASLLDALERRLWFLDTFCDSIVDRRFRAAWRASFEVERERILGYQNGLRELDHHSRVRRRTLHSEGLDGSSLELKMEVAAASFDIVVNPGVQGPRITIGEVMGIRYSRDFGFFELEEESEVRTRWERLKRVVTGFPTHVVEALKESGDMVDSVIDSALDVLPGGGAVKEAIRLGSKILNRNAE